MTNGWIDIKNTDMMLIMGGNPAENHPCGFKWPIEAKLHRNAKMIVVDPVIAKRVAPELRRGDEPPVGDDFARGDRRRQDGADVQG